LYTANAQPNAEWKKDFDRVRAEDYYTSHIRTLEEQQAETKSALAALKCLLLLQVSSHLFVVVVKHDKTLAELDMLRQENQKLKASAAPASTGQPDTHIDATPAPQRAPSVSGAGLFSFGLWCFHHCNRAQD
jgi:hypothetical protein